MTYDIPLALALVNVDGLTVALKAALPCVGVSTGSYGVIAHFSRVLTVNERATAEQVAAAHDPSVLTAAQQDALEAEADRDAARLARVQTALTKIAARRQQITADLAILADGASTTAQRWAVLGRALNAEDDELAALAVVIKAVARLA